MKKLKFKYIWDFGNINDTNEDCFYEFYFKDTKNELSLKIDQFKDPLNRKNGLKRTLNN